MLGMRPAWALLTAALVTAGCGGGGDAVGQAGSDTIRVVAAFYPLEFVARQVGGDRVTVSNLTRPGAEPHDLELGPRDIAALTQADLVVFLSGLQPAVDDAVRTQEIAAMDVAPAADLSVPAPADESGEGGDEGPAVDPHFWLDPLRVAAAGEAVAARLAEVDPAGASTYSDGAAALRKRLAALDAELAAGLASCRMRDMVTAHSAFGYLADRYGFTQVGIAGLDPQVEPDPRTLAEVADLVRRRGISTVYTETLVDPAVAETVASEAGARTAVLDPVEGLTDDSAGSDYVEVMRSNLRTLRAGQECP